MKVQRFCLRSFLQHFLLCCVISSLLCCSFSFDSYAASTNVAADQNGDGQITADEVDLEQLCTYGLVTGYGVTGSDVPGSITGSSQYINALAEIAGSENTIIVGTVADDKITFGSWFKSLCLSIYAELTDASVIGYTVCYSITKAELIDFVDQLYSLGSMHDSYYLNIYNFINNTDLSGDIVMLLDSSDGFYIYYEVADLYSDAQAYFYNPNSYNRMGYLKNNSSYDLKSYYYMVHSSGYNHINSTRAYIEFDRYLCFGVDQSIVVFDSSVSAQKFVNMTSPVYLTNNCPCYCSEGMLDTINSQNWNKVSSNIYNSISTAVMDANNATANQIQSIIDSKFDDITEFYENNNEDGEDGSEGDQESVLGDKLDQNNALQEESNQLQQENNQLQEENNALQEESNQLQEESNALQEEENETSKGILGKITEFFGSFFQNLIDSVVGIFVPDQEDMQANFERLDQFFSDTFGFLYYPFDFLIEVINIFLTADSSTGLVFPGFSIMGYEVWSDISFDITSIDIVNTIFETVRLITGGVLAFMFIQYLRNFFDKRFGGGGA